MEIAELEEIIAKCLDDFYRRRIQKLTGLKLRDTLKKKNPYLFRAIGMKGASELVEGLLQAYMSSSDEGIFGDAFFEPLAKFASGGAVSPSEGVDLAIESESVYTAISIKSGPNIFNASQAKRMNDEFNTLKRRLVKLNKRFDPLLGHGYGNKNNEPTQNRSYRIRSGQALWAELTGDENFYLKIISAMKDRPLKHRLIYEEERTNAINRFTLEFLSDFSDPNGAINWEKLLEFNSGIVVKRNKNLTTVN